MKVYYAHAVMAGLRRYYPVLPVFPEMGAELALLLAAVHAQVVVLTAVIAVAYNRDKV